MRIRTRLNLKSGQTDSFFLSLGACWTQRFYAELYISIHGIPSLSLSPFRFATPHAIPSVLPTHPYNMRQPFQHPFVSGAVVCVVLVLVVWQWTEK